MIVVFDCVSGHKNIGNRVDFLGQRLNTNHDMKSTGLCAEGLR